VQASIEHPLPPNVGRPIIHVWILTSPMKAALAPWVMAMPTCTAARYLL
jgi:hypothetical protein